MDLRWFLVNVACAVGMIYESNKLVGLHFLAILIQFI